MKQKVQQIDTEKASLLISDVDKTVVALGTTQEELNGQIADTRTSTKAITNAAVARIIRSASTSTASLI